MLRENLDMRQLNLSGQGTRFLCDPSPLETVEVLREDLDEAARVRRDSYILVVKARARYATCHH